MNIFVLDRNLERSARYHVDKHIVKIPIEAAQLACNARLFHKMGAPYRPAQMYNRMSLFSRSCVRAYLFTCEYGLSLCKEYTYRYGKIHKSQEVLLDCLQNIPPLPNSRIKFILNMPFYCQKQNVVESYRCYYNREKRHLFKWTKRQKPKFVL